MGLDLGELTIRLDLENEGIRRGVADAKREVQTLPPSVQREMVKVVREMDASGKEAGQRFANGLVRDAGGRLRNARGQFASDAEIAAAGIDPVMERRGRESGGVLAKGIRSGMIRNSPLIVAGVGAALAAGAPLITAGAGALFAGIGAVAAAQTLEVRSAWTDLGQDIRDSAVADAAVLVPVYVEMADKIGGAFQRMRPQLREAFADSAPLIRSFTDGIIALAENAMPGLTRSIAAAGPVFDGLESFLADVGTGLSDFFDKLSENSPAAGEAFAALGDILGDLLPILGELLGQGAELASIVLPPLASAIGQVADAADSLGPLLPVIATGFVALKVASAVATGVASLSTSMAALGVSSGTAAAGASKAATSFGLLGRAVPVLALAMAGLSIQQRDNTDRVERYTAALIAGGDAAAKVRAEVEGQANSGVWERFKQAFTFDDEHDIEGDFEKAEAAARGYAGSQEEVASTSGRAKDGISGVTAALVEQADQALAGIDSGFAYRKSLNDLEDAQTTLNEAIREYGAGSEEAQRAQLGLEEQNFRVAQSWAQQQADLSGLTEGSAEYKRFVQETLLGELYRLREAAGPEMRAAIDMQIAALEAGGVAMGANSAAAAALSGQMRDLDLSVRQIPGQKFVQINAPTEDQRRRIADLGYAVQTLPNGQVVVYADTGPARREVAAFMAANAARSIVVSIFGRSGAAAGGPIEGFAGGGPVRGPGGPTDDAIPAFAGRTPFRLSNGEHVLTAKDVQAMGGQGQVMAFRQALHDVRGFAAGGPVTTGATDSGPGRDRALFHADTVNVVEGTPEDVAQILAYKARTEGW